MPMVRPAVVVPCAARILSGHKIGYMQIEHAVAIVIKTYFAAAFLKKMSMM